jgi:hypothetical protein
VVEVSKLPPEAAVHQLIVLPADVAVSVEDDPAHIVAGDADAVGAEGPTLIVTVALPSVPQHPPLYELK